MFPVSIENYKNPKISGILEKTLSLSVVYSMCNQEYEKIFKEEESIEILKILCLTHNIKEHQKIYNHVWRRYKSII